MNASRFALQLVCLVLASIFSITGHTEPGEATEPKVALLGKIDDNQYVAPEGLFSIPLPFAQYDPGKHLLRDGIFPGAMNVLIEDKAADQRYRIELSDLNGSTPEQIKQAADTRLASYRGLLLRVFEGTPLLIHFATPADNAWEYYYRQDGENTRYHLFVLFRRKQNLVLLWADFVERDVTPAVEDSIINGEHPVIKATHKMFEALTK
jgi:hypothetical protein